jgi:hypothetical protein
MHDRASGAEADIQGNLPLAIASIVLPAHEPASASATM